MNQPQKYADTLNAILVNQAKKYPDDFRAMLRKAFTRHGEAIDEFLVEQILKKYQNSEIHIVLKEPE